MSRLSDLLDADWARLGELSGAPPRPRRMRHAFSPRFAPVALIRAAQCLQMSGWARLAKLPALANFVLFGIEVPPRLPIGPGLVLMHTQGTVLGAAAIGANVTLYQQVTLGAKDMDFAYTLSLRPTVEEGVIVSAGAKVLGGLTLGQGCVVGANAVVLEDVPPGHVAVGIPARHLPPRSARARTDAPVTDQDA
jgi:serine O-acetyltransferase